MMTRRHWKIVINVGLAGLMFELVAFSDFDGAHANDLNMLESVSGSTSSGKFPPPNIVFIFDTSGSMNNLICEDFDDTNGNYECDDGQNTQRSGPNGSTICYNQVFDALTGPDRDQDGTADSYVGLFDPADGVTWQRYSIYPIFDERDTSVTTDDTIIPWTTWTHGDNDPWDLRETGTGSTDWEKLEDVINDHCDNFADCNQRSRCIYSLRTQGYFYESGCSPSGDPMDMCSVPQGTGLGRYCDEDTDCAGTWECRTDGGEYVCSTCDFDSDCTGTCITSAGCAHAHCSESSCSVTIASMGAVGDACTDHEDCFYDLDCVSGQCTGGSLGAALGGACSSDSDCSGTYVCNSTVCSNCLADSDCTGSTNLCVNTGCSHHYCSETGACRPGSHQSFPGSAGGTARNHAFLGDFLNFYPPKSYTLVKAFRDTVENMGGDARIGVARFDGSVGATVSYNIAGDCTAALTDDCLDVTTSTTCFDPMDSTLRSWLFGLSFGGQTPLAEALDDIGAYYANNPSGTANDTICDYSTISGLCEDGNVPNNVVLISDGLPSSDATDSTHVPFSTAGLNALTPSETMSNGYNETDSYGGQQNWVDDVAKALQNIDVRSDLDGDQFIDTYTVSFGLLDGNDCHGVMEKAAVAGGGQCFPAKSVDQLRSALSEIIVQINKKIHGFAAPATSATRRTDSTSLSAALFRPSVDFPLWEGHIFGLQVCDENVAGATCTCPVAGDDVCVVDANGDAVAYDVEGYMTSEPFWDAQLCLSKDPANPPPAGLGPDQAGVDTTNCFVSPANRNIYTVVDSDADGELSDETKIDFSVANVTSNAAFLTALNVGGVIADGEEVVKFFRGYDTGDYDGDGNTTEERNLKTMIGGASTPVDGWWVLGDIFHSIPNVVTRPVGRGLGAWANSDSYKAFQTTYTDRIKTMLVGANDGMLHAIHAGAWDSTNEVYDNGLGKELWAFVSPELLGDLQNTCDPTTPGGCGIGNHQYLVDGSVMVRDIWTGAHASPPRITAADKNDDTYVGLWRTIAVYGHRRGGTTYVALDVTDIENPTFLWQFPEPGATENVAQTWLDVFPAPASIGPMLVEDSSSNVYDRWVVLLSGGYDPTDKTGNALFVLDAYTGEKLWSVTKTTSTGDDTDSMKYSFPATPVFYSRIGGGAPYIDGIVAADHGGQLWHVKVGTTPVDLTSPALTPEIVFRAGTMVDPDGNGGDDDGEIDPDEYQKRSFFFAPTLTRMQGKVRVIIGTGDRDHLVPHGTLSPTDGSLGSKCTTDTDCDTGSGLECDVANGRCSGCDFDDDCTGTCVINDTTCLHSYCDTDSCEVPIEAAALDSDVNDMICDEPGRIYSINLAPCADGSGGFEPCTESDLQQITVDTTTPTNSVYSNAGDIGWYYVLSAGEKVSTPFEILGGYAMYTTFYPTAGCDREGDICSADSRGDARLYARHYVTGRPLDWDDDGTISAGEAMVDLGSGVPTAPAVSVAISGGEATPTLMAGGSDTGLQAKSAAGLIMQLAKEILRFPVSKKIHDLLH